MKKAKYVDLTPAHTHANIQLSWTKGSTDEASPFLSGAFVYLV